MSTQKSSITKLKEKTEKLEEELRELKSQLKQAEEDNKELINIVLRSRSSAESHE